MALTGYYVAQDLIVEKLVETFPGMAVFAEYSVADMVVNSEVTPSIHVVMNGELHEDNAYGSAHIVKQRWLVITAIRNATDQRGLAARQQADPIVLAISAALNNWEPSEDHMPMMSESPPLPVFSDGLGYFPLAYFCEVAIPGAE
jgi:hypothetical protein